MAAQIHALTPHCEAAEFKSAMRQLCGAVSIVAAAHEGEKFGITVSSMTSLTAEPARLLACVNVAGRSFGAIFQSGRMSVNVLARDQELLARRFAGMEKARGDLFAGSDWVEPEDGPPHLNGCLASFDCRVAELFVTHSHAILIGDVEAVRIAPGAQPLLYMDGAFTTTTDE